MPLKTAIVTGSTRGIGRALAQAMLARGINVAICSPDRSDAQRVAAMLVPGPNGARAIGVACDVTSSAALDALWDETAGVFGGVDIFVNNAGLALTGPTLATLPEADLRRMLDNNVMGTMLGCQTALRGFAETGNHGAIYNMLGAGADGQPVPHMIGYATSKAAVTFLTRSLAAEVTGSGVIVGALSPGLVMTEGFLREHARTAQASLAGREAVVNLIGDHPETIGRWAARIVDTNRDNGRVFTWLTKARIRRRRLGPPRDILSRYRDRLAS